MKTSKWKRSMALLLSLLMLCGMLPLSALAAGDSVGRVRVTVSNNTYPMSDGAYWDGELVSEWVDIDKDSTMMSAIVAALTDNGFTQKGAENGYISEIDGLAAFDGGMESGWMGTLNDWFTDTGFGDVSVAKGTLADGDEIAVMYTMDMGKDLGGSWDNNDTTVKSVGFSAGTLSPTFDKDTHAYALTLPAGTESVVVTPTASNKNYQVRTFVGETGYKRTASVPVTEGTVITVKCADPAWPTMNEKPEAAQVYTFTVAYEQSVEPEPIFDPAKLMYSDFRLYPSVAAYEADPNSYYPLTPAYDPAAEDQLHYSVTLPDYQPSTVFGYRTIDGVDGYLTGDFEYNGYSYTTWSSYSIGAGWQGGVSGVNNNYFISKPDMFGEGMYLDDYLSTTGVSKLANVRVSATRSASLKSLAIDGVWENAFDKADYTCSIFVDQDSDGIDIKATGYQTGYTITIGGTTEKSGTAIHVAYQWDENGEMAVPITVTPPETVNRYPAVASTYTVTLKQIPRGDKPGVMIQPQGAIYTLCPSDPAPSAMTVVASAGGEMSYQWFKAVNAEGANAVAVEGATAASYAPVLTVPEDAYYFCRVTNTASGQSADSAAVLVKVYPDPTPTASLKTVAPALTVTEWNGITFTETNGFFYYVGDTATPIEVEYSCPVEGASVQTKWYRGGMSSGDENGLMSIIPATDVDAALACDGATPGMFLYCRVTANVNGRNYKTNTEKIWVYVALRDGDLNAPGFRQQPKGGEYDLDAQNKKINVSLENAYNPAYQWYVNTVESYEGAEEISGGTLNSYTLPTDTAGTRYYFCKATNRMQGFTASANSDIVKVVVGGGDIVVPFSGSGTDESPYLINTVDELNELKRLVNVDGVSFIGLTVKLNADLTLTNETWTDSIGCTKDGTHDIKSGDNLRTFSGTFDGGNHTLTFDGTGTVKALFGYVHNTTIKNLNIQGTENVVFEDHALISTIEGVGLNDTAAIIDHVTLKSGTKTTKSGLVGGTMTTNPYAAASAGFLTTITNCVVEEGCVIGVNRDQSMIGSFAGRLICRIDNCVSYADVYGTNYVGGILGTMDNAMGAAIVINSAFHGTVTGTNNVGGIAGGGYHNDTAPNGGRVNLEGNTVDGTVTGVKNVGGILGGDEYVAQSWGTSYVRNNTFTGTVSGTTNVGAIIGFYDSLNKFNEVSGNLYAADCGADKGIGAVKYVDTNYANPTPVDGTTYFSTEFSTQDCPTVTGCAWKVAHNRTDDPLGADADKLCKVIEEPTVSYTVNVSPKTANASFFKGADAETALAETAVEDKGQVKVGNYTYHQYVLTVPAGVYSYRGNESGVALGGEPFTVPEEDGQSMNLLRVNVRYNGASLNQEGDYSFTLKNGENEVAYGEPYVSGNIRYTPTLLIAGVAHTGTVTLNEKWEDEFYLTGNPAGSFTNTPSKTATSAATLNLPITAYKIIRVTAPKEATTTFYKQDANYVVESVTPDSSTENEDGTVTYMFKGTAAHSNYQFRSMMAGKVTQAGYLTDGDVLNVNFDNTEFSTLPYDDRSILLNVNEKNELHLNVGETFKLRAFRAAWEIINTTVGNQMIEPDFHFAVLSGEGVVSITPTDECSNSKFPNAKNGNATGNWMNVKALQAGTAVVAVWYDAIDVYNANPPAANAFSTFGATDPARYGIFVVTVGEDKNLSWNPVSADGDWDSEFDTVYYVGESGEFTFNPGAVGSVTVQNVYGAALGAVQSVSPNADGSYSVPVTTGANIICADGDYMVVRARQISYTVTNKTTGEAVTNGAPAIKTEDTVEISFSKLDMPLPKMSGIYNPGYMGTGKTAYILNDTYTLTSAGTQYDFSVNNSISFKAHVAGENSLKGYISLSSMGDPFGNHRAISDEGRAVNTNAGEVFGSFGVLPDISFTVTDSGSSGSYENATKITKFSVVAGMNSFNMAFNWNKAENTEACWNKTAAQVSTFGLIPNVTTADYNNVITFRYWYEGEEVHSLQLVSGVAGNITPADFPLNPAKLLHLQVEVKPIPETLGAPVVYNYLAFPGSGNRTYVHPFIKSLSATVGEETVALPINSVDTAYSLNVGAAKTITLNAVQLVQIYNTATTADCSDLVTLTKMQKGETVGESITVLEKGLPNNPNRAWTLNDLDISDADALSITVTSYVDESISRTYVIALEKEAEEEPVLLGDMNGDGEISALDAALVYNYVNEIVDLTEAQRKAADVDGNGEVTALDAALIYNYVNEVIDVFPAGK